MAHLVETKMPDIITCVLAEQCETCIFRPGNKMNLAPNGLATMVRECDADDTNVICHQSEGLLGNLRFKVWCRGSVNRKPGRAVRFMQRLGILQEVDKDGRIKGSQ